jgi:hydroxyacylglutathione hydrolase
MSTSHHADPGFPGWHLLGTFPQGDPDGVASWLLHHGGQAMLLEVPPGLEGQDVSAGLEALGRPGLVLATASHIHDDHFDREAWTELEAKFPAATFERPVRRHGALQNEVWSDLAGEPLCLIRAPKHSWRDTVTVFRGVAMTGDIELGTLKSVNTSVPGHVKSDSMRWLAGFPDRHGYRIHSIVSAHLNDVRRDVNRFGWAALFDPTTFQSAEGFRMTGASRKRNA